MENKEEKDYQYLIDSFGQDKLKERVAFLVETAYFLVKSRNIDKYVIINKRLIKEIVLDYFSDIQRLKEFHEIEKTELSKVAAYTAYWVLKRKPIQIKDELDDETYDTFPLLLDVNEWFASYLFKYMVFDHRVPLMHPANDVEKRKRWNAFNHNLIYFFTYRIVTPQALELTMNALMSDVPYDFLSSDRFGD